MFFSSKWNITGENIELNADLRVSYKKYGAASTISSIIASKSSREADYYWYDISTDDKFNGVLDFFDDGGVSIAECRVNIVECRVNIIEALELECYPGWCKAVLQDDKGIEHILIDKLPVMGLNVEEVANIPLEKYIRVEIVNDFGNKVEINTSVPDGIETEDGETHFVVCKECIRGCK